MAKILDAEAEATRLVRKVALLKSNPHYRMADVIYNRGLRYIDSGRKVLELSEFDGTILKNYLIANGGPGNPKNMTRLSDLIDQAVASRGFKFPTPKVLVLHLRAGDFVQHDSFLGGDYIGALKRYPHVQFCHVVTCFAFQEYVERQWWMFSEEKLGKNILMMTRLLADLIEAFPDIEFDVVSSTDIDHDFAYMVVAQDFIRDGGGFGELIEEVRQHRSQASGVPLSFATQT